MPTTPPDALLFTSPGCTQCATVIRGVGELAKQGLIGKMTVVNVAVHPDQAEEHGVRDTPWLRLGPFTLTGPHSAADLKRWAEWANGEEGIARYVEHLLKQGSYKQAVAFIEADTRRLKPLLATIANPRAKIGIRLGVSALLEAHANTPVLQKLLPQLADLTRHADHRVRADACHLLGLTGSPAARTHVEACLKDANEEVREIAQDAIETLDQQKTKT